jgi:predicted 2-oxoglutarate/Fe(II)-dependent dioxygenase YbiX
MDFVLSDTLPESCCTSELIPNIPGYVNSLRNVLTKDECKCIIEIAEQVGFKMASLYTDRSGNEHYSDRRKSQRCIIDSVGFAQGLLKRISAFIPGEFKGLKFSHINERMRILKYLPGDEFKPHVDGSYTSVKDYTVSKLTILIYLNEDYQDGYTCFSNIAESEWIAVLPTTGGVVIQDQALLHCVPPLKSGCKYAIRTEAMYTLPITDTEVKTIVVHN